MKKTKKQQLELIRIWLNKFPCGHFFRKSCCILEFIDAKEILDFIKKKYKQYE